MQICYNRNISIGIHVPLLIDSNAEPLREYVFIDNLLNCWIWNTQVFISQQKVKIVAVIQTDSEILFTVSHWLLIY